MTSPDFITSLGFGISCEDGSLPMSSSPPGAIPVNIDDPRATVSLHKESTNAVSFGDDEDNFGARHQQNAPRGSKRRYDPQLAHKPAEERRKATVAMMSRKAYLIEKVENFMAPRVLDGELNRGTKEPHKQFPKYHRYYKYLRDDLFDSKYNEFIKDNGEEEARTMATSVCDHVLPLNIFECDTEDGTQHKNLKHPDTKEFNCIGCRNRDGWSRSSKTKIIEVCTAHGIHDAHEKIKEYDLRATEYQKKESRTCQRLTQVAKDLGLYAYVWVSDPDIGRPLPVHSTGREEGRFKKLKAEGRISDEHKNVYTDVSHRTNEDGCNGFTLNMPDKDGCCAPTCVPCHFAWINEKNIQFFDQQTVGSSDFSALDDNALDDYLWGDLVK